MSGTAMEPKSFLYGVCTQYSSFPCRCTAPTHAPIPAPVNFTDEDARRLAVRLAADRLEALAVDLERRAAEMRGLAATIRLTGGAS